MPIYEYQCSNCGNEFVKLMRFSDPNIDSQPCPTCQSDQTHKKLSAIAALSRNTSQGTALPNCGSSGPFR